MEEFDIPEEELRRIRAEAEARHRVEQEQRVRRAEPQSAEATTPSSQPAGAGGTWYLLRAKGRKEGPLSTDDLIRLQPGPGDRIRPTSDREWVFWEEALSRFPAIRAAMEDQCQATEAARGPDTPPPYIPTTTFRDEMPSLFFVVGFILMLGWLLTRGSMQAEDRFSVAKYMGPLVGLLISFPVGRWVCWLVRHLRATEYSPVSPGEKAAAILAGVACVALMGLVPRQIVSAAYGDEIEGHARQLEAGNKAFAERQKVLADKITDLQEEYKRIQPQMILGGLDSAERNAKDFARCKAERERVSAEIKRLMEILHHNDEERKKLWNSGGDYKPRYE